MTAGRHALLVLPLLTALASAPMTATAQDTHLLVIAGLGGTEAFREQFLGWALSLRAAALEQYGVAPEHVTLLAEDPSLDASVSGASRAADVRAALARIGDRAAPDDRVLVVLLGHGSSRGGETRFNLPGPDLTAEEFGALLDALPTAHVALVNAASASGPFIQTLARPGRTVITATKTARERNETRFGGHFVAAFAGEGADLDKNGTVSLLEAFRFARRETARDYEERSLLLTEHALLDDDGDGEGSEEPGPDATDGALAAAFVLGVPGRVAATGTSSLPADSILARLLGERAALEARVAELRRRRSELDPTGYDRQLEALLVELALKSREVRARQGGGDA